MLCFFCALISSASVPGASARSCCSFASRVSSLASSAGGGAGESFSLSLLDVVLDRAFLLVCSRQMLRARAPPGFCGCACCTLSAAAGAFCCAMALTSLLGLVAPRQFGFRRQVVVF